MKINKCLPVIVVLAAISLTFCDKKDDPIGPPEAELVVSPENGTTTTIFKFNTSGTTNPGLEKPELFFRWDWDGDGIWDSHFSKSQDYEHRYFSPGDYIARMEVRNVEGLRDTLTQAVSIQQGFSAPFPILVVEPTTGHIRTMFKYDASASYDDEDSLSTLKFRWDYEGDGWYDTDYSHDPRAEHMYISSGFYRVVVQIKDPSGLTSKVNQLIDVSNHNPNLVVDFVWSPETPTTSDLVTLDASASHDPDDPNNPLLYRWDLNNDKFPDTEFLSDPVFEHIFKEEGEISIRLEVLDQYGLTKTEIKDIFILHSNQPPNATFETGTYYGNLTTDFYFDGSDVRDDEDFFNILEVRWDFESDGVYDTDYSITKTGRHLYGVAGDYKVTMQVKDSGGLTDTTSQIVHVSSGTNLTDIVVDTDNEVVYGAVKIGDQWWTMENVDASAGKTCYRNNTENCETYGGLYGWPDAMNNSTIQKARGICPSGWHVPSLTEWEELFDYLGTENAIEDLEPGGTTDFRLLYAGQKNTNGSSEYLGSVANFWTSSKTGDNNAWSYSMQSGKTQIWKVALGQSYKISVRCVKN